MLNALKHHWPEYLSEAAGLGAFMVSACAFAALLFHPASPVARAVEGETTRRVLMGAAMGLTNVGLVYSPWGMRSGAHNNPAVTLTFYRLGKVRGADALFYVLAQFAGGVAGVLLAALVLGELLADEKVNYVVTVPGNFGVVAAFAAEALISFVLMSVVLRASNHKRLARWTGLLAGLLVALYISVESPISGMSMNPARTFGSAASAQVWTALWVYFTSPLLGMLLAAEVFARTGARAACAKLHHHNRKRCIFNCEFGEIESRGRKSEVGREEPFEVTRGKAPETAALLLAANL
ncbi:MAG TPA: aquaporin [Pyrinomonadaceae bacterium]|nr:aquaporin [Pyrinomonadaceae bacterium]